MCVYATSHVHHTSTHSIESLMGAYIYNLWLIPYGWYGLNSSMHCCFHCSWCPQYLRCVPYCTVTCCTGGDWPKSLICMWTDSYGIVDWSPATWGCLDCTLMVTLSQPYCHYNSHVNMLYSFKNALIAWKLIVLSLHLPLGSSLQHWNLVKPWHV